MRINEAAYYHLTLRVTEEPDGRWRPSLEDLAGRPAVMAEDSYDSEREARRISAVMAHGHLDQHRSYVEVRPEGWDVLPDDRLHWRSVSE